MDRDGLVGEVVERLTLDQAAVTEMFAVHSRLYEAVSSAAFRADLEEKQWVLLLREGPDGPIRGFTTIRLLEAEPLGERVTAVFSGDTGIDPVYWGSQTLVGSWAGFMGELLARISDRRLFWFLISKGYRTYLYLPLFFHEFFPRVDRVTPGFERALIETLARQKYPRHFNPLTGVIEFPESHGHLKPLLAETPPSRRAHPHVRFFLERNPGYGRGNELACVAEISPANMKGRARRMVIEGSQRLRVAS